MYKRVIRCTVLIAVVLGLVGMAGCSDSEPVNKQQLAILNGIVSDGAITNKQIQVIEIPYELGQKFPAVDKMFKVKAEGQEKYGFIVSPLGYRAPINIMVVIDPGKNEVLGIKIMQQDETPGWGEWLVEPWFADRFKGKSVDNYLQRAILEAEKDNEIIQITSATVSTQGVLNGVNAAMGIYRELVLGQESEPVSLEVEGFITEIQ